MLQPLPLKDRAAPGISSSSVKTDVAFQRGGSVTVRTTAGIGPMRLSAQVCSLGVGSVANNDKHTQTCVRMNNVASENQQQQNSLIKNQVSLA